MTSSIVDLSSSRVDLREQVARLLYEVFRGRSTSWQSLADARTEVTESLASDRISRVLLDPEGRVTGWVGGISLYDGHVLEVHPLVVAPHRQGQGIGTLLVRDLEEIAASRGMTTLFVGTDDENGETSLSGADLYEDILESIRAVRTEPGHPYQFYERLGFTIVGVLPDANGPGKPDILMAKRVATPAGPGIPSAP